MKPIIVVSIENGARTILESLCKELNLRFINAESEFDKDLLKSLRYDDEKANTYLLGREQSLLRSLSKKKDCVISIPVDMFLSDGAYECFEHIETIFFEHRKLDDIEQKIEKFLQNKVKYIVSSEKQIKEKFLELIQIS